MHIIGQQERGGQGDSIPLSTRKGTPIENSVMKPRKIPPEEKWRMDGLSGIHSLSMSQQSQIENTNEADTSYNCVGMVFGSRRVHICPSQIPLVLQEDDYQEVGPDDILVGDVVTWQDTDGDFNHIGVIVAVELKRNIRFPRVLSKWGNGGERIHPPRLVPTVYGPTIKYWRVCRA